MCQMLVLKAVWVGDPGERSSSRRFSRSPDLAGRSAGCSLAQSGDGWRREADRARKGARKGRGKARGAGRAGAWSGSGQRKDREEFRRRNRSTTATRRAFTAATGGIATSRGPGRRGAGSGRRGTQAEAGEEQGPAGRAKERASLEGARSAGQRRNPRRRGSEWGGSPVRSAAPQGGPRDRTLRAPTSAAIRAGESVPH